MLSQESKIVADKARKLYEERYRKALEENHDGEFVCIEPKSGDFFLGGTFDEAVNKAMDTYPDRLTHTLRVGRSAAFHLGVMIQSKELLMANFGRCLKSRLDIHQMHQNRLFLLGWTPRSTVD